MTLLLWFFVCWFLTAASAEPLRKLLGLSVKYFVEGLGGVKVLFWFNGGRKVNERWLNGVRYTVKRGRNVSITYETLGTGDESTGEDFQNRGTFIVVRSSVFPRCSAHKVHLSRDANYACWDSAGRRQERLCAPEKQDVVRFLKREEIEIRFISNGC